MLHKLKIKYRLTLLLVLMSVGMGINLLYTIHQERMLSNTHHQLDTARQTQTFMREFNFILAGISNDERGFLITGKSEFIEEIAQKQDEANQLLQKISSLSSANKQQNLEAVQEAFSEYMAAHKNMAAAYQAGNTAQANEIHFEEQRSIRKQTLYPALDALTKQVDSEVKKGQGQVDKTEQTTYTVQIALALFIIITGLVIGIMLISSILRPLQKLNEEMVRLANGKGDLTNKLAIHSDDELGTLVASFNRFIQTLRSLIINVRDHTTNVSASATQLSTAAANVKESSHSIDGYMKQLAQNMHIQNEMTQHSAAAIEQAAAGLQAVSDNSQSVSEAAFIAMQKSSQGLSLMETTVEQMSAIHQTVDETNQRIHTLEQRSKEITEITATMEGIASQTNLLALNAAIEAARAGESGKGFAVVAEEVKKLAEQSAQSAQHISKLVQEIQQDTQYAVQSIAATKETVVTGVSLTHETKGTFDEIRKAMNEIHKKVEDMAAAFEEINSGTEEVSTSMQEISAFAAQVSSASEEISASSNQQVESLQQTAEIVQALYKQTEELNKLIEAFRV
ncbi:MAG: methyl-accepting chemotaxis protein [Ectobacillus sp.]